MALKVVDASAFAAVAFAEPEEEVVSRQLEGYDLAASRLFTYEITNIAWKKILRREATVGEIRPRLERALSFPVALSDVNAREVFELALETGLSAYDASYLWLAEALDVELVSLDGALAGVYASRH